MNLPTVNNNKASIANIHHNEHLHGSNQHSLIIFINMFIIMIVLDDYLIMKMVGNMVVEMVIGNDHDRAKCPIIMSVNMIVGNGG